jgi:hypothetical protein
MFELSDIVIVGDSFAFYRDQPTDWPSIVVERLTGIQVSSNRTVRGAGYPGCSWWSTRNRIIEEIQIKTPLVMIVCHTEFSRIPNDNDIGINAISAEQTGLIWLPTNCNKFSTNNISDAGKLYYRWLYSERFHQWANNCWIIELDDIIKKKNIFTIHVPCFSTYYSNNHDLENFQKIENNTGIVISQSLCDWTKNPYASDIRNHMTEIENIKFGNRMAELILNYYEQSATLTARYESIEK